jgi:hypothetical protein
LEPGIDDRLTFDFRSGGSLAGTTGTFTARGRTVTLTGSHAITQTSAGLGINSGDARRATDDEINSPPLPTESLTLTFDSPFKLESISFSNAGSFGRSDTVMFVTVDGQREEFISINRVGAGGVNTDAEGRTTLAFADLEPFGGAVETIVFEGDFNGFSGSYSVTGLTEIPLPGAAWLLVSALGGLGYLRYRRRGGEARSTPA